MAQGEILAIHACLQDTSANAGIHGTAIISLLYAAGLQSEEVVKLYIDQYNLETGKRNRQRTVYITNGAANALSDWLYRSGTQSGPLFVEVNKGNLK